MAAPPNNFEHPLSGSTWRNPMFKSTFRDTACQLPWQLRVAYVCDDRSVTLKLQRGERSISAEQYESATVYFSDVSDFAELSASYNPMQIVAILNEIYKYVKLFSAQLHMRVAGIERARFSSAINQ